MGASHLALQLGSEHEDTAMGDTDSLLARITIDPKIMVGKPTVRGLRITVAQILSALAAGVPRDELLSDYPELEADDIRAALLYARELVEEEQVLPVG